MEKEFRIQPEVIDDVNKLLAVYKGTRNFHNFTSGQSAKGAKKSCRGFGSFRLFIISACSEKRLEMIFFGKLVAKEYH